MKKTSIVRKLMLAIAMLPHVRTHDLSIVVVLAQVGRHVGVEARNDHTDVISRVDVALGDSCGDVLARGVQTEKLALYSVSIRPGLL